MHKESGSQCASYVNISASETMENNHFDELLNSPLGGSIGSLDFDSVFHDEFSLGEASQSHIEAHQEQRENLPKQPTIPEEKHVETPTTSSENSSEAVAPMQAESSTEVTAQPKTDSSSAEYKIGDPIFVPHENDVLLGRGGRNNQWSGNEKLRLLARELSSSYGVAPKRNKPAIAWLLVTKMKTLDPPGRFLKQDQAAGEWFEVDDEVAREKASQCLRDIVASRAKVGGISPKMMSPKKGSFGDLKLAKSVMQSFFDGQKLKQASSDKKRRICSAPDMSSLLKKAGRAASNMKRQRYDGEDEEPEYRGNATFNLNTNPSYNELSDNFQDQPSQHVFQLGPSRNNKTNGGPRAISCINFGAGGRMASSMVSMRNQNFSSMQNQEFGSSSSNQQYSGHDPLIGRLHGLREARQGQQSQTQNMFLSRMGMGQRQGEQNQSNIVSSHSNMNMVTSNSSANMSMNNAGANSAFNLVGNLNFGSQENQTHDPERLQEMELLEGELKDNFNWTATQNNKMNTQHMSMMNMGNQNMGMNSMGNQNMSLTHMSMNNMNNQNTSFNTGMNTSSGMGNATFSFSNQNHNNSALGVSAPAPVANASNAQFSNLSQYLQYQKQQQQSSNQVQQSTIAPSQTPSTVVSAIVPSDEGDALKRLIDSMSQEQQQAQF